MLAIDDDPAGRDAFQLALEGTSCDATVAVGGEQGLSAFEERKMDLVFLDLKMPGMDEVPRTRCTVTEECRMDHTIDQPWKGSHDVPA